MSDLAQVLISSSSEARTSKWKAAFNDEKVTLISTTDLQSTLRSLKNPVDILILDTEVHHTSTPEPIWKVSLAEWEGNGVPQNVRKSLLFQIQKFLHHIAQKANAGAVLHPFRIIVTGSRLSLGDALQPTLDRLQRDISLLHPDAGICALYLDPESERDLASSLCSIDFRNLAGRILHLHDIQNAATTLTTFKPKKPKIRISLSFDFDAISALLGTGYDPANNMNDFSSAIFAGRIGALRILRMLQKYTLADKVTWFIPGHTMESFEPSVREIVSSGAEIALHGYAHEGADKMTPVQERDVLLKCMEVSQRLTGKKVRGYRAPMYQLRDTTVRLLKEFGFLYDSSLSHHDCQLYFTPCDPLPDKIDFSRPASSWMKPVRYASLDNLGSGEHPLVEIPTGWYNEDMMSMQYFPHAQATHGFVDPSVVEKMWRERFLWFWNNSGLEGGSVDGGFVYPLLMHPDTSGMPHVLAMVDRFVGWLRNWGDLVTFDTCERIAGDFLEEKGLSVR